ncbi:MAG TPA: hypothetical protein VMU01_09465 [Rhizomicrobium sp.]|nr:hypothetical protein [Rhizomicrobium sp.]
MKLLIRALVLSVCCNAALGQHDVTAKYGPWAFSGVLMPSSEFLGFIGPNYQRLRIQFGSIKQDDKNPLLYHVTGTSQVKQNKCDFEGTITLVQITDIDKGSEDFEPYKDSHPRDVGTARGRYEFRENPKQKNSGVFSGEMRVDWFLSEDGTLVTDDVMAGADGYRNNQYKGTWTSYAPGAKSKTASWGEYRIPESGDLDWGAAEFMPNPAFKHNGWDDYKTN